MRRMRNMARTCEHPAILAADRHRSQSHDRQIAIECLHFPRTASLVTGRSAFAPATTPIPSPPRDRQVTTALRYRPRGAVLHPARRRR